MRKSIYLLTTTPSNFAKVQSMDDNCGEWVECMGVASGCGEQEAGVASGSGWNLWVWLLFFLQQHPYFLFILLNVFRSCTLLTHTTFKY